MAESSAAAWLSTHPDGLRATFSPSVGALRSLPDHPGSNMQFSSTDLLSTPEGGAEAIATWQFNLGFHPPISRTSSLDEARAHFAWVALDRVPLPGLAPPLDWDIYPQTPSSSFKEGVEILAFSGGRMKLRIKSSFFAIYGRKTSVSVPADAASPPGTYFQIRQNIPMDLTLDLPVAWD